MIFFYGEKSSSLSIFVSVKFLKAFFIFYLWSELESCFFISFDLFFVEDVQRKCRSEKVLHAKSSHNAYATTHFLNLYTQRRLSENGGTKKVRLHNNQVVSHSENFISCIRIGLS